MANNLTMRVFVESLRRLYRAGKVSLDRVKQYYRDGKITAEEYDYITG